MLKDSVHSSSMRLSCLHIFSVDYSTKNVSLLSRQLKHPPIRIQPSAEFKQVTEHIVQHRSTIKAKHKRKSRKTETREERKKKYERRMRL